MTPRSSTAAPPAGVPPDASMESSRYADPARLALRARPVGAGSLGQVKRRPQRRFEPNRRPTPPPRELAAAAVRRGRTSRFADLWRTWRTTRQARWDLPPEPHDWRWAVGLLGRTLVVVGVLMLGFVGYQLWGTGIGTARAQADLRERLEERFSPVSPDDTVADVTAASTSTTAPSPTSTAPDATETPTTSIDTPATPDPQARPANIPSGPILVGDPVARLQMPSIGTDHVVVAGIGVEELRLGPGHFPDTPLPGQFGNAAIAGHRTTYGQPFHDVDQLVVGDDIVVTTEAGRFTYVVNDIEIVLPSDYEVVATVDRAKATLTLTSCHPKWSAAQRIIVHAALDPERSDTVGVATDYRGVGLWGDPIAIATEEVIPVASTTAPANPTTTRSDATSTTQASTTSTSTSPTPAPSVADSTEITPPMPIADAFSRGWFHDPGALWHVAAWGGALAAVVAVVLRISRRRRSHLVGLAYGLLPGLVLLYFVYENVNRLLPPDL